jgi:hypothetical protein
MQADTATPERSAFDRDFDVCVIGAGPAGITLARRLAATGAQVALMEAGGWEYDDASQAIYTGENVGLDYFDLDYARLRYFGGSSNHWGGWCRALDPQDFRPRAHNPWSGWPIGQLELDRYRAETDAILDLPPASALPDLPMPVDGETFRRIQFRFSPPTHFASKYGPEIVASPDILLGLNANLVDLRLTPDHGAVSEAVFRSLAPDDPGFPVRARRFCLATGGIENARLLLNFRSQALQGIGNGQGLVGRFFCEHPHFVLGEVMLPGEPLPEMEFYAPTELFTHDAGILNFGLRFEPGPWPPTMPASAARVGLAGTPFELRLLEFMREEARPPRRAVTAENMPLVASALLRTAQEQALNPDSRVMLAETRDALGLARVRLDWRLTELDIHTMRTVATEFGRHLAETGRGRARLSDWLMADPDPPAGPRRRRGRRQAPHVHHPHGRRPPPRRRRCRLPRARRSTTCGSPAPASSRPPATPTRPTRSSSSPSASPTTSPSVAGGEVTRSDGWCAAF